MTKQAINTNALASGTLTSFEYTLWRLTIRRTDITITAIYHPPSSPANNITNAAFIADFTEWVMELVAENKNVIILGDFNMDINNPHDADANILIDTLEALGFQQHVDFSTHQHANTLDLVFSEILKIRIEKCVEGSYLSDHVMVTARTSVKKEDIKVLTYNSKKKINYDLLTEDVSNIIVEEEDLDELIKRFGDSLRSILDKHAPEKRPRG